MTDPLVTMADARAYGWCVTGVARHIRLVGLDVRTFIKVGYPASVIEATGPHGARLAEFVRARNG